MPYRRHMGGRFVLPPSLHSIARTQFLVYSLFMLYPILVVEDDLKIARIIRVYLEGAGFRVIHTDRGETALDAVNKEKPMLIILDLMLPDMSGEELCLQLKEIGDIPIIMVTAKATEEERVAGFALGADDYVVKPFSPRELVFRVKAVLKRFEKGDLAGNEAMSLIMVPLSLTVRTTGL